MSKRAYLFIAHGSREKAAQEGFDALLSSLRRAMKDYSVLGAYLTLNEPSIVSAVEAGMAQGINDYVIVPLFFFEGAHVKKDIPQILADLKLKYADLDFQVMPPVASIESFSDWVVSNTAKSFIKRP